MQVIKKSCHTINLITQKENENDIRYVRGSHSTCAVACCRVVTVWFRIYGNRAAAYKRAGHHRALLGEARGEGKAGVYAVGCVIKQRMNHKSFPSTATGVCLQRSQFEYWVQNKRAKWDDQNRANVLSLMKTDKEIVRYAKQVAIHINSLDLSYTNNADHYCHINEHNYWTKGQTPVRVIEKHKFYKLRK